MGRGSYTANDWTKLRNAFSEAKKTDSLFVRETYTAPSKPLSGVFREARDNVDSPESTPVIIGFDVTSSMGYLAEELALNSLNKAIMYLYDNKPILCPQVMCCAIGDCKCDRLPLQVTQFESDIRILSQLTQLKLEGGGGGNGGESYNLAWYFAAERTCTDAFEKRRRKGHLITIGDDFCHSVLTKSEISRVFGDDVPFDISDEELISAAEEKYNIFHIHIDKGTNTDDRVFADWQKLLPGRTAAVEKNDISILSELIYALISVGEGSTPNEALSSVEQCAAEKAAKSLAYINISDNNTISF